MQIITIEKKLTTECFILRQTYILRNVSDDISSQICEYCIITHTSYFQQKLWDIMKDILGDGSRPIEASDSITDRACGLVGKRGDTAMRVCFFSFK